MVNLPDTRPEMVAADFEGVTEAIKAYHVKAQLHCMRPLHYTHI